MWRHRKEGGRAPKAFAFILRVFASGHSHAAPLWGNDVVDANEQCERVVGTPDIPIISRASPYLASFDLLLVLDPCSYRKPCSHSFRLTIYTNKKTIENCILSPKQFLLSRSICLPYLLWRPILCYIVLELYIIVYINTMVGCGSSCIEKEITVVFILLLTTTYCLCYHCLL